MIETTIHIGSANRVFLIFVVEKYMQITQTKVSLVDIIKEAHIPGNESGPYFSKISSKTASAPLPVNGLIKMSGKISLGNPISLNIGERILAI